MAEYLILSSLSRVYLRKRVNQYRRRYELEKWIEQPWLIFFVRYKAVLKRVESENTLDFTIGPVTER